MKFENKEKLVLLFCQSIHARECIVEGGLRQQARTLGGIHDLKNNFEFLINYFKIDEFGLIMSTNYNVLLKYKNKIIWQIKCEITS